MRLHIIMFISGLVIVSSVLLVMTISSPKACAGENRHCKTIIVGCDDGDCVTPIASPSATITPEMAATPEATIVPTEGPTTGGSGQGDGRSDGKSSCPDCTKPPVQPTKVPGIVGWK